MRQAFETAQHAHVIEQALRATDLQRVPLSGEPLREFVHEALRRVVACEAGEVVASAVVEELEWTLRSEMLQEAELDVSGVHASPRSDRLLATTRTSAPPRARHTSPAPGTHLAETLRPTAGGDARYSQRPTLTAPPRVDELRVLCAQPIVLRGAEDGYLLAAMRFSQRHTVPPLLKPGEGFRSVESRKDSRPGDEDE